jgi:hypothetical protein
MDHQSQSSSILLRVQVPAAKTALDAPTDQSLRVPCYCEENIWRLTYRRIHGIIGSSEQQERSHQYHVAFVSNPNKCVPMFQQLAVSNPKKPCFWDYHVILFCTKQKGSSTTTSVLDMDSHLPYPCALPEYLSHVFPSEICWPDEYEYAPFFRYVWNE